jgi:hypothetical protein
MSNPTGKGGFLPGKSGNPGGRAKSISSLALEARKHALAALGTLVRLMKNAKSEQVRVAAAREILDRGFGKAIQALQIDAGFAAKKLNELSDAELVVLEERIAAITDEAQPELPNLFRGALN